MRYGQVLARIRINLQGQEGTATATPLLLRPQPNRGSAAAKPSDYNEANGQEGGAGVHMGGLPTEEGGAGEPGWGRESVCDFPRIHPEMDGKACRFAWALTSLEVLYLFSPLGFRV